MVSVMILWMLHASLLLVLMLIGVQTCNIQASDVSFFDVANDRKDIEVAMLLIRLCNMSAALVTTSCEFSD